MSIWRGSSRSRYRRGRAPSRRRWRRCSSRICRGRPASRSGRRGPARDGLRTWSSAPPGPSPDAAGRRSPAQRGAHLRARRRAARASRGRDDEPVWIDDMKSETGLPRAILRARSRHRRRRWQCRCPPAEGIVAVLEFFAREPRPADEALSRIVSHGVAAQLGPHARAQAGRACAAQERGALPAAGRERRGLRDRDARPRRPRRELEPRAPSASPATPRTTSSATTSPASTRRKRSSRASRERHLRSRGTRRPLRALRLAGARGRPALLGQTSRSRRCATASRAARLQLRDPGRHRAPRARRGAAAAAGDGRRPRRTRSSALTSEHGIVTSWNPGAERLFGYSARARWSAPVRTLLPDRTQPTHGDPGQRDRPRSARSTTRCEAARKNGSVVDVSLTVSPIRDAERGRRRPVVIARDVTDRKRAQHYLEQHVRHLPRPRHRGAHPARGPVA